MTQTVDPDRRRFPEVLAGIPEGQPIVMLNLLKFRPSAAYPEGHGATPCSGQEAYRRYAAVAAGKLREIGAQPVWMGKAVGGVIAPPEEVWDEVLLVRYPSIEAFLQMLAMPDYRAATVHRTAALEDARLVATVETSGRP